MLRSIFCNDSEILSEFHGFFPCDSIVLQKGGKNMKKTLFGNSEMGNNYLYAGVDEYSRHRKP